MEHKAKYFGLDQGDGELEKQKPGFHKGMLLRKKTYSTGTVEDKTLHRPEKPGGEQELLPREVC